MFCKILLSLKYQTNILNLSSWVSHGVVEWLLLAVPWGCLWFMIVVFPDHTHYFCSCISNSSQYYDHSHKPQGSSEQGRGIVCARPG